MYILWSINLKSISDPRPTGWGTLFSSDSSTTSQDDSWIFQYRRFYPIVPLPCFLSLLRITISQGTFSPSSTQKCHRRISSLSLCLALRRHSNDICPLWGILSERGGKIDKLVTILYVKACTRQTFPILILHISIHRWWTCWFFMLITILSFWSYFLWDSYHLSSSRQI